MESAERYLIAQVDRDGRVRAPCSARALETALFLHVSNLDRDTARAAETTRALRQTLTSAPLPEPTGSPSDLGDIFSRLIVRGVLGDRVPNTIATLRGALGRYAHHSSARKEVLFSTLLAEVGGIPFAVLDYTPDSFTFDASQHWAHLAMTAARMIYGAGTADARFIAQADVEMLGCSQSPNGSWEDHILVTLVILIALARTGALPDCLRSGVSYVTSNLTDGGGVPFVPDVDTWLTGLVGNLLVVRGSSPDTRDRMASYIAASQLASGGWGFSKTVRQADVDNTAICQLFLRRQDEDRFRRELLAAESYLLDCQNDDGGFPTYLKNSPSEVEVTAHAVMALARTPRRRARISRARDWLLDAQRDDGSFRCDWTLSAQYALSQALVAISAAPGGSPSTEVHRGGLRFILDTQNEDGGWGPFPGLPSTALSTSYALISLGLYQDDDAHAARRSGLHHLLAGQHPDGRFESPPDALGPRPVVYDVELYATIYAHWALSSVSAGGVAIPKAAQPPRTL